MRTTNIAELKNHLSNILADVKLGEEILISDRNKPFAKIVLLHITSEFSAEDWNVPMGKSLSKSTAPKNLILSWWT